MCRKYKRDQEFIWPEIQAYKTFDDDRKIKVWYKVRTERDVETVIAYHQSPDEFVFPLENLGFMPSQIFKNQGLKRPADEPTAAGAQKIAK